MGMARGKVGDVVLTRMDGEQVTRVRNRHPKNPKTPKQLLQRAVMATVMQAYSAGKEIFDHSFEGLAVPAGCQRRFQSVNAKALRSLMASEINGNVAIADQKGAVVAPGANTPVSFEGLVVSEGSATQNIFVVDAATSSVSFAIGSSASETAQEMIARVGYKPGDIFTIVGFAENLNPVYDIQGYTDPRSKQFEGKFFAIRYIVKETIGSITGTAFEIDAKDFFDMEVIGLDSVPDTEFTIGKITLTAGLGGSWQTKCAAVIYSREDNGIRSSSKLVQLAGAGTGQFGCGIAPSYALAAWLQGTPDLGDSDLILEGGDV